MVGCTIYPIPLIRRNHDISEIVYRADPGRIVSTGGYAWYIKGAGPKILVDAGANAAYINSMKKQDCEQVQTLEEGLAKLGLRCNDIDIVIFTHLHHDHTAFAHSLTHARLLARKEDIETTHHPHPFFSAAYPREFLEGLNFEAIEGEDNFKITDDVFIFRTTGHTAGGQSVAVRTAKGLAIISGMCAIDENFFPSVIGSKLPVIPSAPHECVIPLFDSMLKIKQMADIVIPSHEGKYLKIKKIPE
jgi:N-acyl homoserine lactone hydrolase